MFYKLVNSMNTFFFFTFILTLKEQYACMVRQKRATVYRNKDCYCKKISV